MDWNGSLRDYAVLCEFQRWERNNTKIILSDSLVFSRCVDNFLFCFLTDREMQQLY